jgi:hypothetical protein
MTTLLLDKLSDIDSPAALIGRIESREHADQLEKDNIIMLLRESVANRKETANVDLQSLFISRVPGSTFDDVNEPARIALVKIIDEFRIRQMNLLLGKPLIGFDEQSGFFYQVDVDRWPLSDGQTDSSEIKDALVMLTECATQTGGYLFSGEVVNVLQWLRFYKYIVPATVADVINLIAFLTFKLPPSPEMGDYHELLSASEDSPFYLSDADRQIIGQVCAETTQGKSSLLQYLNIRNFNLLPVIERRKHAATFVQTLLASGKAKALGARLHERLQWHLDTQTPEVAERQVRQLVVAALILDSVPQRHEHTILGYDVYQPGNASRNAAQVCEALEHHLIAAGACDEANAPLLVHLCLSATAPELLVTGSPADLTLDKPRHVVLTQAVNLIEVAAPGATRMMTYTQIIAFSELSSVSAEQGVLHELSAVEPVINWAVMNDVIPYSEQKQYDQQALEAAADYFERYIVALNRSEKGLLAVPPDKREMALKLLQQVLPKGYYLEHNAYGVNYEDSIREKSWLQAFDFINPAGVIGETYDYVVDELGLSEYALSRLLRMRFSIVDLYLSGDLLEDGKFTSRFKIKSKLEVPAHAFERIAELPAIDKAFDGAFEKYYQRMQESLASVIKMAIIHLPEAERQVVCNGSLSFYTVRKSVNDLNPFEETQNHRDEAKGRYGLLICSAIGDSVRCFELFTLRGVCRESPAMADMLQRTGIIDDLPTLSYVGSKTDFQVKNPELEWPLDFAAYREGSEVRTDVTSNVVVEKLWQMSLGATDVRPVSLFFSPQLNSLTDFLMTHHPVATRNELYAALNTQTELQQLRTGREFAETAFLNLVVPFKKCVEDIRSGNAPSVSEGIGGCILDGLSVLGLLIGLGATVINVLAKTGSTTAKVLSIAKSAGRAVVALINPIDGLPTLAFKGVRKLQRGLLLLGEYGASALQAGTGQLRALAGGGRTSDLIQAVRHADVNHGSWRAAEDVVEAIDLAVLQRNSQWYALNLRTGGAWGPRLKNLKLADFSLLRLFRKPKPHSYTRAYVNKAIPHAKGKLDSAISQLLRNSREDDIRVMAKCLFGSDTDEALTLIADNLRAMRMDLDRVSLANMSFRQPQGNALAALRPAAYKRWKTGIQTGAPLKGNAQKFIDVYPEVLDEHYRLSNFDDARLSDVLIHELSHGAPDLLDLYYCQTFINQVPADYDVIGLAELARDARRAHPKNLSNPHFRLAHPPGFEEFEATLDSRRTIVRKNPALINAESYSVAVAMLHQRETDYAVFTFNLSTLRNALKNTERGQFLQGTLLLNMTKLHH